MSKLMTLMLATMVAVAGSAEDMRIWNGGMPVGSAAWYLRDSTPQRLIAGNGPTGRALVNYRDGKFCIGEMPGIPSCVYQKGKLYKGHIAAGRPACEFRDNKLIVDATQVIGVFTPHNRRFYKGRMPVGSPAFTWKGDWPEAMLVYVAFSQYASGKSAAANAGTAASASGEVFRVKDRSGKVVCTYSGGRIWDGDTTDGEPAWNYDSATKTFRKGGDRTGVPVATFKGRYLLKGDGSDPGQFYSEFLMMSEYEPGKTKPDSFGCWDDRDFSCFYPGFRTFQTQPQGEPLLNFDNRPKAYINPPTKHFIVWKYLMDK